MLPLLQDLAVFGSPVTKRKAKKPGEAVTGDILVAFLAIDLPGADLVFPGFTSIGLPVEQPGGVPYQTSWWWAIEEEQPEVDITWDGNLHFCLCMMAAIRHAPRQAPVASALLASPSSRKLVRAPGLNVVKEGSLGVMFAAPTLDNVIGYSAEPPEAFVLFDLNGYFCGEIADLPEGEAGPFDAELEEAAWNVAGLLIFEPKDPPEVVDAPVLDGVAAPGEVLTVTHGSWSNEPLEYDYQWEVSTSGGGWVYVPSASKVTFGDVPEFTVPADFGGHSVRCLVRATNEGGPTAAPSNEFVIPGAGGVRIKAVGSRVAGRLVVPSLGGVGGHGAVIFEGDQIADFHLNQSAPGRVTEVPDPAGSGETVFRMEVHNEDIEPITPTDNPRAELLTPEMFIEGSVIELEWGLYLPAEFPFPLPPGVWSQYVQIFGNPFTGNSPWNIKLQDDEMLFQRNQNHNFDKPWGTRAINLEEWIHGKTRIKQAEDGWIEQEINGVTCLFFDPDADYDYYNPSKEPTKVSRLSMPFIEKEVNDEKENFANIQAYYKHDAFASIFLYHKPLIIRAI